MSDYMTGQNERPIPMNDLHFNMMTTDTLYGTNLVPPELKTILNKEHIEVDKDGKQYIRSSGYWEMLGFYTRDMRLGFLSQFLGEVEYCKYYLDLANDFLRSGFVGPFLICLSRVATQIEISHSRGGNLRKLMNTITQEHKYSEMIPEKKNFFGVGEKEK